MKAEKDLSQKLAKFTLIAQPIFDATKREASDFELLLHSKDSDQFPVAEFSYFIKNNANNEILLNWFTCQLKTKFKKKPQEKFAINLEPQQLFFQSTLNCLKELKIYHNRLSLEITERPPKLCTNVQSLVQKLQQIKALGFELTLDDVGTGMNTSSFVLENAKFFKRIKFSLIKSNKRSWTSCLEQWFKLAQSRQIEFVIEGIDNPEKAQFALSKGIYLQQGFLWNALAAE
ncbi:EAL domain-containing protein [Liquorilactobacillus vini]|uniref:EAL domain-containing protein n=1 Tax=Liquorilactobacillus vini DSM 20605 TaxID=1133569 RepID=A0A0R2BZ24_9LACO|nr:EAL domain-containing protein [Liquorilactobacillus vini]KRM83890.1 hypothetical protein FD21_GL000225 [Liquorilactobacillus vini DSM 20605]